MDDGTRRKEVWNQQTLPVVFRREKGKLRLRVPYEANHTWIGRTQHWLRGERHSIPEWLSKQRYWEVPAAWFNDTLRQLLDHYGSAYVIQPYNEQEICAQQCWDAKGHECQCKCMGANHGQGKHGNWLEISDTFATRWGEKKFACLLMTRKA